MIKDVNITWYFKDHKKMIDSSISIAYHLVAKELFLLAAVGIAL